MKKMLRLTIGVLLLLLVSVLPAAAQYPSVPNNIVCPTENKNDSYQYGFEGTWLEYSVDTTMQINLICALVASVATVANTTGVPGTTNMEQGKFSSSVKRSFPVPGSNWYTTNGHHYFVVSYVFMSVGETTSRAEVKVRQNATNCSDLNGGGTYYEWSDSAGTCVEFYGSPILISRTGYKLTAGGKVPFDLNGDGVRERVAWTRRDSDDAWLAMDRNGNGVIDDGTELFGNHTPASMTDASKGTAGNGFEALQMMQLDASFGQSAVDTQIDARDAVFSKLLLWCDSNQNGISEPDELVSAADAGVAAISIEYKEKRRTDQFGNQFRQKGMLRWADGSESVIWDVWLKTQN